jgi:hypothetical protein
VDRLNNIIEQINTFAHPPASRARTLLCPTARKGPVLARERLPFGDTVVDLDRISPDLPPVGATPRRWPMPWPT